MGKIESIPTSLLKYLHEQARIRDQRRREVIQDINPHLSPICALLVDRDVVIDEGYMDEALLLSQIGARMDVRLFPNVQSNLYLTHQVVPYDEYHTKPKVINGTRLADIMGYPDKKYIAVYGIPLSG